MSLECMPNSLALGMSAGGELRMIKWKRKESKTVTVERVRTEEIPGDFRG